MVVSPDIASNMASVKDSSGTCVKRSGSAPELPRTSQNEATIRNPSRSFSSPRARRAGSQIRNPAVRAAAKLSVNTGQAPSP